MRFYYDNFRDWQTIKPEVVSVKEFEPSLTDKSYYVPMAVQVASLKPLVSSAMSADQLRAVYDFPDGNDDGSQLPIGRRERSPDPAMVQSEIEVSQSELSAAAVRYEARKAAESSISSEGGDGGNPGAPH